MASYDRPFIPSLPSSTSDVDKFKEEGKFNHLKDLYPPYMF
jgi:hypothetical protein